MIFANRGRTRSHKATLARDAKRRLKVTTRLEEPTAARTEAALHARQMCPNVSNRIRLRNTRGSGHKRGTGRDKAIPGRTIASVLNTHTHAMAPVTHPASCDATCQIFHQDLPLQG